MRQIVKYKNRKFYDKKKSGYVTLKQLGDYIRNGENVQVLDHTTKNDITYNTLVNVLSDRLKLNAGTNESIVDLIANV